MVSMDRLVNASWSASLLALAVAAAAPAVPLTVDTDGDGILDASDNCPLVANPSQVDGDSDGIGNACDNCPAISNPTQGDVDADGIGNACEAPHFVGFVTTHANLPAGRVSTNLHAVLSGTSGTVLLAYRPHRTAGSIASIGSGTFWHQDFVAGDDGTFAAGTFDPKLVGLTEAAGDSFVTIGGSAADFGNSTSADPGWGASSWNQPGIPDGASDGLAGWYNAAPGNLQGQVDTTTMRTLVARFVTTAQGSATVALNVGFNAGLGTTGTLVDATFTLGDPTGDWDGDGIANASDNCYATVNANQSDCDSDGIGDVCDAVGNGPDCDSDGNPDACEIAQGATDINLDGIPDSCQTGTALVFAVPGRFATIQSAVAAAPTGSIVSVGPGTYSGSIDYAGKNLSIQSTAGAASTVIDGTGAATSVVVFVNGETAAATLEGFTIRNGTAGFPSSATARLGGGIYAFGASPTIRDCIVENCSVPNLGGGIYARNSSMTVDGCVLRNCTANYGAGAYFRTWHGVVVDCEVTANVSSTDGGGVQLFDGTGRIETTTISGNSTLAGNGGGVHMVLGAFSIEASTITGNTAFAAGGGVSWCPAAGNSLGIVSCSIRNNTAGTLGGGFARLCTSLLPTFSDSFVCGNGPNQIEGTYTDSGGSEVCATCTDTDTDGSLDCADPDDDGDGTEDASDGCPLDATKVVPGQCGCGNPDTDTDGDGTANCVDGCPSDGTKVAPGQCGCGNPDTDSDGDGTANCVDGCPSDPNKISGGICGCGVSDADSDGDGTANCVDGCPSDPNKTAAGICGCGVADTDSDGDGTANCLDGCPNDANKLAPGQCGCGVVDTDSDGDGTANCNDGCPSDASKTAAGQCGCGNADTDTDSDGTADCNELISVLSLWGRNDFGQCSAPAGLSAIADLAAGRDHTVVLRSSGTVACFGRNDLGQCTPPGSLGPVASVAAGRDHSVARLVNGTVTCWGSNSLSQSSPPVGLSGVTAVAAGSFHSMALKGEGSVVAWGWNFYGQTTVPGSLGTVTAIAANGWHSLALGSTGTVAAWGRNDYGQATVPAGLTGVTRIAAGESHSLAVNGAGVVTAWGRNDSGQCTVPVGLVASAVSAGSSHSMALRIDGTVVCWGGNANGQSTVPAGLASIVQIAAGSGHSAAVARVSDIDSDLVPDATDNCPSVSNADQANSDGDALGNVCDGCPTDANKAAPGVCGCGVADADSDGDGTLNCNDGCPSDANKTAPGVCGCGVADADSDGDGTLNCNDGCPSDANKTSPGQCGCGNADTDGDGDGTANCNDGCPTDANKTVPGQCGCGTPDTDSDGDGTADCNDVPGDDSDGDGVPDESDRCPNDPSKTVPGTCGCGTPDSDSDGDGIVDCLVVSNVPQLGLLPTAGVLSGDDFGAAVAMDGAFAVVGLPLDDLTGKSNAGSARVFQWNGSAWAQVAELLAPSADSKANDNFGASVAIHGDVVVVGAPLSDVSAATDAGAAYVYRRSGSSWPFEAKLTRATPAATDRFGTGVAVRGDFVAVGAPQANFSALADSGEVRVFKRVAGSWTGTTSMSGVPATGGDRFGQSVSLGGSATSPTLAAGATADDESGKSNCGAVYVMPLSSAGVVVSTTRLIGNPAFASGALGTSVAVDGDGLRVASGAPTAAPAGTGTNAGSVTAWTLSGATWTGVNLSPSGHAAGDRLGRSVAFDPTGSTLVVGNSTRTQGGVASRGGAVVFSRLANGAWTLHDRLVVSASGTSAAQFGQSVAVGVNGILVGGPKNAPGGAVASFSSPSGCASPDSDGDGTGDACDDCPSDPNKVAPGVCGCGTADTDGDGDGMANCYDACPTDAAKTVPGTCGCGVAETDTDADGTKDCLDTDDDNDGTADVSDGCPLSAIKTAPGQCGCAVADTDSDGDGTANCNDLCPSDPGKVAPGICGCGTSDVDSDGDGLTDCFGEGTLPETGTLTTTGVLTGDDFGFAVSGDGTFALVGLPNDDLTGKADAGTARVAEWTGSGWVERAQLLAPSADAKAKDFFGTSVSIQGDVAVVGAPNADIGATLDAGAAYVYRNVGGTWTFEAKLTRAGAAATDKFGTSVSVLGDFIAVGTPLANVGGLTDSGEVRVFKRAAGTWTLASTATAGILTASDLFGQSVSLGGSMSAPTLVVGCPGDDETGKAGCGAAYIHALSSSGAVSTVTRVISPAPLAGAALGRSVTVDATGTRVAAGAPIADVPGGGTDCGSVTVWSFSGSAWSGVDLTPADRAAGENFGASVSLRADGAAIVAGSPLDKVNNITGRGSAVVMTLEGGSWVTYDRLTLPASGTSASNFGRSVAFRGTSILVGGPKHTPPAGGTVRSFEGP